MEKSSSADEVGMKPQHRKSRCALPSKLIKVKKLMQLQSEKIQTDCVKDDYDTAQNAKDLRRGDTGLVFDDFMSKHYCMWDNNYPEGPARYACIIDRLTELGLTDKCLKLSSREATEEEILQIHSPEHLELLKSTDGEINVNYLEELSSKYDSIYLNQYTYKCALLAAGCAISLVEEICTGKIQNGMAIIRPPGHHASQNEYCGYCFFNNAAIAVEYARKKLGINKILIVDWDVHHGQGTQQIFYDDPTVLYFSIHRYERGLFWPNLRESNFDCIGEREGLGYNVNIPMNHKGVKDADYIAIFHQILLPMAYEFQPELIIVSAGFDAALGCPEFLPELVIVSAGYDCALGDTKGEFELSPSCFAHLTHFLMTLAEGKVAILLEGGYCLKSLAESAAMTMRALVGDPIPNLTNFGRPSDDVIATILDVISAHRPYWKCFSIYETYEVAFNNGEESIVPSVEKDDKKSLSQIEKHYVNVNFHGQDIVDKPEHYATRSCYPVQSPEVVSEFEKRLNNLLMETDLFVPLHRVVLAYDESMTEHENLSPQRHPENPNRIKGIFKKHVEFEVLERCKMIQSRTATKNELLLVHSEKHVNEISKLEELSKEELIKKGSSFESIYFHPQSFKCASLAAGCLLQIIDEVLLRTSKSGVAIVRPPGHHAEENTPCGFCLFNNVSLGAKYAIECHNLKRILILDWDVHHGNGTQRIFESDKRVLYISLHRYNNAKFFPYSTDGNFDKAGIGNGEGFNVNIPWNHSGGGLRDADYFAAFFSVVLPIAYQFDPELILVSAGFDACVNDPLGKCKLTPEFYAHVTHMLSTLAKSKIILSLEGGYNITSVSYAMTLCSKVLLGDPPPRIEMKESASPSTVETLRNVIKFQSKYWSCLKFYKAIPCRKDDNLET